MAIGGEGNRDVRGAESALTCFAPAAVEAAHVLHTLDPRHVGGNEDSPGTSPEMVFSGPVTLSLLA
jgi:hypothetical protein